MVPVYSYAGEFKNVMSYNKYGLPEEDRIYIWDIDQFPVKVCVDSKLSRDFQISILSAIGGWNQAWSYILGRLLERGEIKRNQIGIVVPPWKILEGVLHCTKEKSDQAADAGIEHIFITANKLPGSYYALQRNDSYKYSSSDRRYLYKSIIEINQDREFSFKNYNVPEGKMRLGMVVRHELGHALGLPHNTAFGTLMYYNGNRCVGQGRNECNIKIKDGIHFANLYGYFTSYTKEDLIYKSKCKEVEEGSQTILICYD